MKHISKNVLIAVALASFVVNASAQIATFNSSNIVVGTSPDSGNPFDNQYITPTYDAGGSETTVSNLSIGPGIEGTNLEAYGFGLSFSTGASTSVATAQTRNAYIGFSVTVNKGYELSLTGLDLTGGQLYSQDLEMDQATRTLYLESSVDGFTTEKTLGSVSVPANVFSSGTDLSLGSAFQDLKGTTEFRLYIVDPDQNQYESVTLKGTDALVIDGSTSLVPEPSTYALLGLGLAFVVVTVRNRRAFGL